MSYRGINYLPAKLWVLVKRLSVLFLLYQLFRLVFFLYNRNYFHEVGIRDYMRLSAGGMRFDLTALLYLNILYVFLYLLPFSFTEKPWYKKFLFFIFIIFNSLGFLLNIIDVFYFDYTQKRSTVEIFMFAGEGNIGILFWQFLKDFWWGALLLAATVYATAKWYRYVKDPVKPGPHRGFTYFLAEIALLLVTLYFAIAGIRGGFGRTTRPISVNNAGAYIRKPLEMAVVLNTPFTLIRTINKQTLKPVHYYSKSQAEQIFSPVKHFDARGKMKRKNVVLIIVESLAREYSGLLNRDIPGYRGYTPFLDSLMLRSHTFSNAYANGRKSIDAMPSILASLPSLRQPYVLSPYSTNELLGLGTILKKQGYTTAFFHGAPNGSMGFDAIANLTGFDAYYGATEYGNPSDSDGYWGVPDDKFLQYTARTINTFDTPFAAVIFTLSSHHPFILPEGFKDKFEEGKIPIHKVIRYTDYSLKHFFETAGKMSWFSNTIFIITADHCNQNYLPEYRSSVGYHAVPIVFFDPGNTDKAHIDSTLTQQTDILPRLLCKLNYSGDIVSFGNDPSEENRPFVVYYAGETWEYMEGDYLLRYRNGKTTGLFNYRKDKLLKKNLIERAPVDIKPMTRKLKAFIQQYTNRLIENRLVP